MDRFQCPDCGIRTKNGISCRRCGITFRRQVQICRVHGTRCLPGCRMCRTLTRSESGY